MDHKSLSPAGAVVLLSLWLVPAVPAVASAQTSRSAVDLANASLADLMNIEISSASRKEQRLMDTPAAVYVISAEDIRRSGATTVPEVLRMAPGVQVARINGNKWAVSLRGFNALFSNKLLVLVDGRTIYNGLFSGVLWDNEDLLLEDVERIEIVRGPGGATWGANAVNGVINIVTRPSAATAGTFLRGTIGSFGEATLAARQGGTLGTATYRASVQAAARGSTILPADVTAEDNAGNLMASVRFDGAGAGGAWTIESAWNRQREQSLFARPTLAPVLSAGDILTDRSELAGGVLLARWTRPVKAASTFEVQTSVDGGSRHEAVGEYRHAAADVQLQYRVRSIARHDVIAGGGYRWLRESLDGRHGYALVPAAISEGILSAFAQDEIALTRSLAWTVGAKIEHHPSTGAALQPTTRVMWSVGPHHRFWGAFSHAQRTPSINERYVHVEYPVFTGEAGLPIAVVLDGAPDMRTETVRSAEGGYRFQWTRAGGDVTAFHSSYDRLRTNEPLAPALTFTAAGPRIVSPVRFGNLLAADTRGVEVSAYWQAARDWRLDGAYSSFHLAPALRPASGDQKMAGYDGTAPAHHWFLHSSATLARRTEADVVVLRSGALKEMGVPAYVRVDARLAVPVWGPLTLVVVGQNLFDARHPEFLGGSGDQVLATELPRSARLQLEWTF